MSVLAVGFSFKEIAAIKSSSVHYHFPAKDDVVRRWAEYTSKHVDGELEKGPDPVRVWTNAFRGTALSEGHICPCTVLGAASEDLPAQQDLPAQVASEGLFQDVPRQTHRGRPLR